MICFKENIYISNKADQFVIINVKTILKLLKTTD